MEARRCQEDRYDFTEKDGRAFPIQMTKGGPTFGFCPAKILRDDPGTYDLYVNLIAILETHTWPRSGGIDEQDSEMVELVAQFGPLRRDMEFRERFRMVSSSFSGKAKGAVSAATGTPTAGNRSSRKR